MTLWWLTKGPTATCGLAVRAGMVIEAPPLLRWAMNAPRYPKPLNVPWPPAKARLIAGGWHGVMFRRIE